jgi:signal transduction histidine kinase
MGCRLPVRTVRVRTWVVPAALAVVGVMASAGLAVSQAMSSADVVELLEDSVLGSASIGALAAVVLILARRARIGLQIAVAAVAPVAAVGVGVVWASSSMFLTGHDESVLWVVLVSAGTVGMVCALVLGQRVALASREVGLLARYLDEGGSGGHPAGTVPAELEQVAEELRATSARLEEARADAAAGEKARRDLVAWVSHDLRTPLAGIRLMAEALEERVVDDAATADRYYRTIRVEADRLSSLVDDLFELSRLEAGAARLDMAVTALGDVVADAVDGAAAAARTGRVELHHTQGEVPVLVAIDVPAVTRVVRNLVDNAIRHTPVGSRVTIRTGLVDGVASVTVIDACGGIPEADLGRVFDAGYRGDLARTPGPTGGGFGLTIARGLIEAHHGRITVDNVSGGCCFAIRLPTSAAEAQPTPLTSHP